MSIAVSTLVWKYSTAKGGALLVLLALADYADEGGSCFPSIATLARRARQSERAVQYNVQKLVKLGELEITEKGGGHRANNYQLRVEEFHRRKNCAGEADCMSAVKQVALQRCNGLHPNNHVTVSKSPSPRSTASSVHLRSLPPDSKSIWQAKQRIEAIESLIESIKADNKNYEYKLVTEGGKQLRFELKTELRKLREEKRRLIQVIAGGQIPSRSEF